jgi:CubicO group peptidase (beta-lactamase class C family)
MKPHVIIGISLLSLSLVLVACIAAPKPRLRDPALPPGEVLAAYVDSGALPGLAVSVIRGGENVYREAFGLRKKGEPARLSIDDPLHIGSDTKAMTALLCGMAVDEGLLAWDSRVGDALGPEFPMRDEYRRLSLDILLSHRSGLPAALPTKEWLSYFGTDADASAERGRMAAAVLALKPAHAPGKAFLYSNFNYVVAGAMLEKVYARSWEELMRERLFDPLGMETAGFGPPAKGLDDAGGIPAPWGHSSAPVDPDSPYADNPPSLGPAGTVHASIIDMEKYVSLYFTEGLAADGRRLVSAESLRRIAEPMGDGYALGWGAGKDDAGRSYLAHDGSNTMFYCSIVLFPESRDAIIAMANRGDGKTPATMLEIVRYLGQRFLGATDEDAE